MKILFISVYYPEFLKSFNLRNVDEIEKLDFQKHRQRLLDELFGDSSFYSEGVRKNGHEAEDIIVNDLLLQNKWAKENDFVVSAKSNIFSKVPFLQYFFKSNLSEKILEAQIRESKPDVLYFQDIEYFSPVFIKRLRRKYFIVAQKASPIFRMASFKEANLVFTSFPHYVDLFKRNGINSEYLKLAFGKRVLNDIPRQKQKYNCTFIGGISRYHSQGVRVLSKVSEKVKLDVFGYGKDELKKTSALYKMHHSEVWGKDMYKVMMQSKMTINRHIDVSGKYANNMRLFESTGCGTMLLTDSKVNLEDFFKIGKEIVVYENPNDLVRKIKYYSGHVVERDKIALAGQLRTLKDHNYELRMKEMLSLLAKYNK